MLTGATWPPCLEDDGADVESENDATDEYARHVGPGTEANMPTTNNALIRIRTSLSIHITSRLAEVVAA